MCASRASGSIDRRLRPSITPPLHATSPRHLTTLPHHLTTLPHHLYLTTFTPPPLPHHLYRIFGDIGAFANCLNLRHLDLSISYNTHRRISGDIGE